MKGIGPPKLLCHYFAQFLVIMLMLATDWHLFIITTSVWATEGLVSADLLATWCHYRNGYIAFVKGQLTPEKRELARAEFSLSAQWLQRELGMTAWTREDDGHRIPA
jgi:hypothetical protein